MSTHSVNFIGFGNVKGGRCIDAEIQLDMILEEDPEVVCIAPYTLIAPGKSVLVGGNPATTAPKMIPGFVVITKEKINAPG